MSNWVSCLVNVVVLFCLAGTGNFCLASTGGRSGGSGLAGLTTTKPTSLKEIALKPVAIAQKAVKFVKTHLVKTKASTTPMPLAGRIITNERYQFAVIRIQYVNEKNDQKILECGGTILDEEVVLTDAGCFKDRKKKSKPRKDVMDNSDILQLRGVKLLIREITMGRELERDVSKVEVYRNPNSQKPNEQINIARVIMNNSNADIITKPLEVCKPSIIEDLINTQLFIVGWRECFTMNWVDIQVKVTDKSNCKKKHTKHYGGPNTHCAFPTSSEQDWSGNICTDRGGPVLWKVLNHEYECLFGVINDGDLSEMGRNNSKSKKGESNSKWKMFPFFQSNSEPNIIFTSLEEYAKGSKKHEFIKIYPILKK